MVHLYTALPPTTSSHTHYPFGHIWIRHSDYSEQKSLRKACRIAILLQLLRLILSQFDRIICHIFCHVTFAFFYSVIFAKLPGLRFIVFIFEVGQSEHVQLGRVEFFTFVDTEQEKPESFHNTHLFRDHRLVKYIPMFLS